MRRTIRWCSVVTLLVMATLSVTNTANAQTPIGCPAESSTAVTVNPTRVRVELPEHTSVMLDGSPAVTSYMLGWYAQGATAPTSQVAMAKTAFAPVANTTFCYDATLPPMTGIPLGQKYLAAMKSLRNTEESAWSGPSNPFGFEGPVVSPTWLRIRK